MTAFFQSALGLPFEWAWLASTIIGILLIALSFWNPGGLLAGSLFIGGPTIVGMVFSFGMSLLLGGLMALISTPTPDTTGVSNDISGVGDPAASRYLGSNKNTTKIGTRVSVAFGVNKIPGQYVSFNIDSTEGRGQTVPIAHFTKKEDAVRAARGWGVMGVGVEASRPQRRRRA